MQLLHFFVIHMIKFRTTRRMILSYSNLLIIYTQITQKMRSNRDYLHNCMNCSTCLFVNRQFLYAARNLFILAFLLILCDKICAQSSYIVLIFANRIARLRYPSICHYTILLILWCIDKHTTVFNEYTLNTMAVSQPQSHLYTILLVF
jgi:hypothetical protein